MVTGRQATVRRTRPDDQATLADGLVVDLFLAARLFGRRILTLDGRVILSPTRMRTLDPPRPSSSRQDPRRQSGEVTRSDRGPAVSAGDDQRAGRTDLTAISRRVDENARRLRALRGGRATD